VFPFNKIGVGCTCEISNIRRRHIDASPHHAIGDSRPQPHLPDVGEKGAGSSLMVVVVVALFLQVAEDRLGIGIGPVREHHDIFPVKVDRVLVSWLDDDRASYPGLFQEPVWL
jgi:hypothetical protein